MRIRCIAGTSGKDTMCTKKRIKQTVFIFLLLLIRTVLILTACTSKEDVVLELENQEKVQSGMKEIAGNEAAEQEEVPGQEKVQLPETESNQTRSQDAEEKDVAKLQDAEETDVQKIYVHICGAVTNPGVYELKAGSRVYEVIEAAGGLTENACGDYVNQAAALQDGQKVTIPTKEEMEIAKEEGNFPEEWTSGEMSGFFSGTGFDQMTSDNGSKEGFVNINTATESELCTINGIGESKAAAIVKYRQENGSFSSIEEIMQVSGIGEGTYEKIKDRITVN